MGGINFDGEIFEKSSRMGEGHPPTPLPYNGKPFPKHLAQLSIWTIGLGILDIKTQLNSLKIKWKQRLLNLNLTSALWKNLMLYQLNLILNYNQGLALFR